MGKVEREQLGERLSAYLDGELDRREQAAVEGWLKSSEEARARLAQLRRISSALGSLPRHPAPPSIWEDVLRVVEREDLLGEPVEPRFGARAVRIFASLLAAAAILFLSITVGLRVFQQMAVDRQPEALANKSAILRSASPDIEAVLTLEQKLQAGMTAAELAVHRFAVEPNVLQLAFADATQRRLAYERFLAAVRYSGSVDLAAAREEGGTAAVTQGAFHLPGRAGFNYEKADETQLLVRLPRSTWLALLLEETPEGDSAAPDGVTLALGPLRTSSVRQVREWLGAPAEQTLFAPADDHAARSDLDLPTEQESLAQVWEVLTSEHKAEEHAEDAAAAAETVGASEVAQAAADVDGEDEPGSLSRKRRQALRAGSRTAPTERPAGPDGAAEPGVADPMITVVVRFVGTVDSTSSGAN